MSRDHLDSPFCLCEECMKNTFCDMNCFLDYDHPGPHQRDPDRRSWVLQNKEKSVERKTIYLGGPMAGCTIEEMTGWRNQLKKEWSEYDFRDPCDREYTPQQWRELVEEDIKDIDESDYVLCYMWKPGVGSSMELVYARYNDKPIIVVVPDFKYVSPWVRYYSDFLVEDFNQAYKIIKMAWANAGVEDTHHA